MCHDFNSTSILIDSNHNARISNFGMVKVGPVDSSGQVIYTKGYVDPEYIKTGKTII
ncbi:putative non-specific serine/threonine protein kinase [Helianthus anomalus]